MRHRLLASYRESGTTRTAIVGINAPLGSLGSLTAVEVLGLHSHIAMSGGEGVAACRRTDGNGGGLRHDVVGEVIVPNAIADMLLNHHAIPLAAGQYLIIFTAEQRVATETL